MKLITERSQIRDLVAAWGKAYGRNPNVNKFAKSLSMLDPETATAADVAAIIGSDAWSRPEKCHECGLPANILILVGEELDYESSTARLCLPCLEKALALMVINTAL